MSSYLLVYRRSTGELEVEEFGPGQHREAFDRRLVLDRETFSDPDVEVVVFQADSMQELKRTHGRYFYSPGQIARAFKDRSADRGVQDALHPIG